MATVIRRGDGSFTGERGARLAYRSWQAADPRAVLIVAHGLGDHSGRYAAFGEHMAEQGVSTFAMDLRGHGRSAGRRGHIPSFDLFLKDLDRFRRELDVLTGFHAPTFLLGHSMGGLIALRYLEEYDTRFAGAVIVSPWLATAMPVPRLKAMAAPLLSRLLPWLPFDNGIDAADLSHDPATVESYRNDPLVHGVITPRLFSEVVAAMRLVFARSDRIQLPLLLLLAGADRVVDTVRSLQFGDVLTAADRSVRVVPEAYHEVLNEVDRVRVHREVSDWMVART
jgi:alpha-beta hydrolase superfamily lysophospholipase